MSRPLANRLSVHVLHDLTANCPRTILALESWMDHCAFWLADLASHPATPDQINFMIGLLALGLAKNMGWTLPEASNLLRDEMVMYQLNKELSK
jgi:hypothetical protein